MDWMDEQSANEIIFRHPNMDRIILYKVEVFPDGCIRLWRPRVYHSATNINPD